MKDAWFKVKLSYAEAKALRSEIGDVPKHLAGPRLLELYRSLDARFRLLGSIDDPAPRLRVVKRYG